MLTKIINSAKKISPFGGLFFVINELKNKGLAKLIDSHLGRRVKQARYSYSDIILNWCYCNLCGAERLEDIEKLRDSLDMKLPSHDALGTVMKSFKSKIQIFITEKIVDGKKVKITHQFNINKQLNNLLVETSLKLGLLNTKKRYTLDYDNTIITHHKYDRTTTYEMTKGYQPGVSFIDKIPVYIEGRNGNSNALYQITETVKRSIEILKESSIKIGRFRSDSAAYARPMFKLMEEEDIEFFIRARRSNILNQAYLDYKGWEEIQIHSRAYQTKSIDYTPKGSKSVYRMVIYRTEKKDEWKYLAILTNNWKMTEYEVIKFYNMRGDIERNFDDLKNNFNWHRLPFSFLNENTVFMILSAITSIIYQYLIRKFSKKVNFVKRSWRLRRFKFLFIDCSAILTDGQLTIFTDRDYSPLME